MSPRTSAVLSPRQPTSNITRAHLTAAMNPSEMEKKRTAATSPTIPSTKDVRAFEHDRQRVKKAADLVKMRARKGQGPGWASKFHEAKKVAGAPAPPQLEKGLREEVAEIVDSPVLSESKKELTDVTVVQSAPRHEVKLTDLVVTRKPRKGKEGDFEVIPHVRSVIVLDDNIVNDIDMDEPWEHINGVEDEDSTEEPTYAKVAALAK